MEAVPHIGTYRRSLPVDIERLYENAIDWEHLPWVHRSTFSRVECLEAGAWGFRARVWPRVLEDDQAFLLELRLDRECRRWITRTLEGPGCGSEVWTHAFAIGAERTDIVVDFFAPGQAYRAAALGRFYIELYTRLYDEDVPMMATRQQRLREVSAAGIALTDAPSLALGPLDEVRARLPLVIELGGWKFRVVEVGGELFAHGVVCPHQLGPLEHAEVRADGSIECPWHGYRFDLRTGACRGRKQMRLKRAEVRVDPVTTSVTVARARGA